MTLCLNSVFNDDEKTIAFRAHKNIFYLIVNKKRKKKMWTEHKMPTVEHRNFPM